MVQGNGHAMGAGVRMPGGTRENARENRGRNEDACEPGHFARGGPGGPRCRRRAPPATVPSGRKTGPAPSGARPVTARKIRTPVERSAQSARTSPNAGRLREKPVSRKPRAAFRGGTERRPSFVCRAATLANPSGSRVRIRNENDACCWLFRISKLAGREDGALSLDGARTLDRAPLHRLAQIRCSSGDAPSDLFGGPPPPLASMSSPCATT